MADLNIITITRPKLPRNKYGYLNNGQIIGGNTIYNGDSSGGGGDSSSVVYHDFIGATASRDGSHGLVPAPSRGQQNYVLHGSGTWRQLFGGHLQYDSQTGTLVLDTSLQGTKAVFNDVSAVNINSSVISTKSINSSNGNIKNLNVSVGNIYDLSTRVGTIRTINSSTVNSSTVNSHTLNTYIINGSTGHIKTIDSSLIDTSIINASDGSIYDLVSENITTHNLEVTGFAHFYELLIDKIKSVGGSVLLTPADGFVVEKVIDSGSGYRLYWSATDGEKAIANMWEYHDQAICMTFNNAQVGMNYDISNKYYWSLIISTPGTETIDGNDYHYIEISKTVKDGVVNPSVGDEIVMLGSRNTQDLNRQNAIYISAYDGLDTTLEAPFICQYKGINDFNLSNHKYTWFAANGNNIRGSLKVESGDNVEDLLFEIDASLNQISSTVQENTQAITNLQNQEIGARNYVRNTSDEWSDWIPFTNINNQTVNFGDCYLPAEKNVGDYFTSQITVEWSSVEDSQDGTFRIGAQSPVDGGWTKPSFWNAQLVNITSEPEDGVVTYVHTYQVTEQNKDAVLMKPAFRIDYALGSFRYKCVQIEKGNVATDWTPAPEDFENSITTITNNMSNITQTVNQISSTVSSQTTRLNNIDASIGTINTEISQIDQKADSITSTVERLSTTIGLFNDQLYVDEDFFSENDYTTGRTFTQNFYDHGSGYGIYDNKLGLYRFQLNTLASIGSTNTYFRVWNDYTQDDYLIQSGIYQISFKPREESPRQFTYEYYCKVLLYNKITNQLIKTYDIVAPSESIQTYNQTVIQSFQVSDECKFCLEFGSTWNDKQIVDHLYLQIADIIILQSVGANSIIEQKADSITSTVNEMKSSANDNLNLFGKTSIDGGSLNSGNRWLFIPNNKDYNFTNWDVYNTVFVNGIADWHTYSQGETWVYSPYLHILASRPYTLNCTFNYDLNNNKISLVKFGTQQDAMNIVNPVSETIIGTDVNVDYREDVITFTPSAGYYRLKFSNIVSNYDQNDRDFYMSELEHVRLYQGTYTANEFNPWPEQTSETYTKIQQTGHSIELKVYQDLNETGIDIENKQITVTADNFTINNNNNEQVLGTDADGNLEVTGTIRANNLYHGLSIFIDGGTYKNGDNVNYFYCSDLTEMQDECEQNGWDDYLSFEEGKYYEWPNEKASHFGTAPYGFIECTYSSDIIWLMAKANATQWQYNTAVNLPKPTDFPGKIVQIYGSRSVTSTATGISIKIGCVESNSFALGIYADSTGQTYSNVSIQDSITISPQKDITFISFNDKWIILDYKDKSNI